MNMLTQKLNKQRGFTIVELLIVIVVIAILAGITVTAFSGVTYRANATKTAQAAASYAKLIKLYRATNGKFPTSVSPNMNKVCLGAVSDLPAEGVFEAGRCVYRDDGYRLDVSTVTTDAFKTVASALPSGEVPTAQFSTETWRGFSYANFEESNPATYDYAVISWKLSGQTPELCAPGTGGVMYDMTSCSLRVYR